MLIDPIITQEQEHAMSNDQVIVDEIRDALASDPRVHNAAEVAVSERAGRVTLRGTVRSLHQRQTVVGIAGSVRGVRAVDDELRIDPRDHWKDEELRGAALQALICDDSVPADWLDVKVTAGWVTLTGEVDHQSDSDAAFAAVRRLDGVGGITNEIRVVTAGLGR
jgi:osmotically-inducible protein OsmY